MTKKTSLLGITNFLCSKTFLLTVFVLLISHLMSSGRLTGDALTVFVNILDSNYEDALPRRYFLFSYIFSLSSLVSVIFNFLNLSNAVYFSQIVISQTAPLMWLASVIMLVKGFGNNSKIRRSFILGFFFTTPMIFLSNELIHETFIIFLISIFFYAKKNFSNNRNKVMFTSIFLIILIKIYFIPLVFFMCHAAGILASRKEKLIFSFILFSVAFIYFIPQIFLQVPTSQSDLIRNFEHFVLNSFHFIFSFNHGFFACFHIFSFILIYHIFSKSRLLLALNMGYIFMFLCLPHWHGDMVGSRYMLPVYMLNFCYLIEDLKFNALKIWVKKIIPYLFSLVWFLNLSSLDYDVASFNRYYDGSAHKKLQQHDYMAYSSPTPFHYWNFPYFDLSFHPLIFTNRIIFYKALSEKKSIEYLDGNIYLEKKNIYPRKFYSLMQYIMQNSNLLEEVLGKNSFSYEFLERHLRVIILISYILTFSTPFVIFLAFRCNRY